MDLQILWVYEGIFLTDLSSDLTFFWSKGRGLQLEEEGCPGGISSKQGLPPKLLYHHTPQTDESPSGWHVRYHVVVRHRIPLKLPEHTESRLLWWRVDHSAPDRAVCQQQLLLQQSCQGTGASAHKELHSGQQHKKVGESDLVAVVPLDNYQL